MATPDYPVIITNASWQKEKGSIAKLVGKTGVGEALQACQNAYGAINGLLFSPKQSYPDIPSIEKDWQAAKTEGGKFEGVRKLLSHARDLANAAAGKYKANKLVPSSSTAHALSVAKECDRFAVVLRSYGEVVFKAFEQKKADWANNQEIMDTALKGFFPKCRTGFSDVKKSPDAKTYNDKCWQAVRGLGAQVPRRPALKQFEQEMKVLASLQPSALKDKTAVLAHITKLEVLVNKIEAALKK